MEQIKLGDLFKNIAVTRKPDTVVTDVVTDSRKSAPGNVFVAIVGERLDGNDYAQQALKNGAEAAVVSRRGDFAGEQIVVRDTKDALIEMAGNYRARYSPKVVGITGSVGKTTTKEMTAAIFNRFGKTLKNEGNQNNEVGVPTTLFSMDPTTELAVIEMGMNGLGDISKLTRAVRPRAAAITAIGVSHLEHLGSRENILKAKLEIIEGIPEDGILVINGDDEMLMGQRDDINIMCATFAIDNTDCDVVAKDIMSRLQSTEFTIEDRVNGSFPAMIPCSGEHNVRDALAAYTLATRIGLEPELSAQALADYVPTGMRQKFVELDGITVIEDCYNASPDSMIASLKTLASLPNEGLKIAVLGDMRELGEISKSAHRNIGYEAAAMGIDILLCIGDEMINCAEAARNANIASVEHFSNKIELAEYLSRTAHEGDAVIFKASRAMALEDVIFLFYAAHGTNNTAK